MFAKVNTAGLLGINGFMAEVEADIQNGLPSLNLTGALSPETKEAQYRIWNALKNSGIRLSPKKITVNFSPAYVKKEGTYYDLPIAAAILGSMEIIDVSGLTDTAFIGEIGLDGSIKFVRGVLPMCLTMKKNGIKRIVVPAANAVEAALLEDVEVYGASSLSEVIELLSEGEVMSPGEDEDGQLIICDTKALSDEGSMKKVLPSGVIYLRGGSEKEAGADERGIYDIDFSDIHGQEYLKRAAEIAVSGRHNILFSGPAGTGKTMVAKRMPTIMPLLTREEDLDISMVYSICGLLPEGRPLLSARPFRSPHHGISEAAFAGGGPNVMPGEMTLASKGILFLDELPLFPRGVLETLRQPMEEGRITVTRVRGSCTYPADFMLVGAMNNCACGHFPDRNKCSCSVAQIKAYTGRLSKPLMERIDICAEARPVSFDKFAAEEKGETSETIRKRVERVYEIQLERFRDIPGIRYNSRMGVKEIEKFCVLGREEEKLMKEIYRTKGLSGRTFHKILKVARTIADMEDSEMIGVDHLVEAAGLRNTADALFEKRSAGKARTL